MPTASTWASQMRSSATSSCRSLATRIVCNYTIKAILPSLRLQNTYATMPTRTDLCTNISTSWVYNFCGHTCCAAFFNIFNQNPLGSLLSNMSWLHCQCSFRISLVEWGKLVSWYSSTRCLSLSTAIVMSIFCRNRKAPEATHVVLHLYTDRGANTSTNRVYTSAGHTSNLKSTRFITSQIRILPSTRISVTDNRHSQSTPWPDSWSEKQANIDGPTRMRQIGIQVDVKDGLSFFKKRALPSSHHDVEIQIEW